MTSIAAARRGLLHVPSGRGTALWVPEDTVTPDGPGSVKSTYTIKASSESTGGALSFVEASVPPGSGPPPHQHLDADEAYYILSGEFRVIDGASTLTARAGDFIFIPRGCLHGFKNVGADAARMVFMFTPAGFEELFAIVGEPARSGEPATVIGEQDVRRAAEAAPRFFPTEGPAV